MLSIPLFPMQNVDLFNAPSGLERLPLFLSVAVMFEAETNAQSGML